MAPLADSAPGEPLRVFVVEGWSSATAKIATAPAKATAVAPPKRSCGRLKGGRRHSGWTSATGDVDGRCTFWGMRAWGSARTASTLARNASYPAAHCPQSRTCCRNRSASRSDSISSYAAEKSCSTCVGGIRRFPPPRGRWPATSAARRPAWCARGSASTSPCRWVCAAHQTSLHTRAR